jgi:hypothetical protein
MAIASADTLALRRAAMTAAARSHLRVTAEHLRVTAKRDGAGVSATARLTDLAVPA